jgi:hypothetical protein
MWYDWVFAICPIVIAVRPLPSGLFYTCTLNKNAEARVLLSRATEFQAPMASFLTDLWCVRAT